MLVPNSCGGRVKSVGIPFSAAIVITGIIIFNIYIFIGYTTQIGEIYRFKQDIHEKKQRISKLLSEQKEVQPTLKRSYQIAEELSRLKLERAKILTTWRAIQRKGGRVPTQASRGVIIRAHPYILNSSQNVKGIKTSLMELQNNNEQIESFISEETTTQKELLEDLLAYERKLDHTPSIWPISSFITSWFGNRYHPLLGYYKNHTGVDLRAAYGTKVKAAADGRVKRAGYTGGYGYLVVLDHGYGYQTYYAHNSRILVSVGQVVKKGQVICLSGNSGTSTGPHLHYEVRINGHPVNPVSFFRN